MKKLIIIGASGHGKVVADIALKSGYKDIAFLDDNTCVSECAGFPVIGRISDFKEQKDCDFIVAIGDSYTRNRIMSSLEDSSIITLIHPDAVISRRVTIGKGTVVLAGAVINSDTVVGKGCIISTCASVDHDNSIEDYVHIAVGAHLCGTVRIGKYSWIGAGATISNNIDICEDSFVGAGAVVVKGIYEKGTYVGVPARKIK